MANILYGLHGQNAVNLVVRVSPLEGDYATILNQLMEAEIVKVIPVKPETVCYNHAQVTHIITNKMCILCLIKYFSLLSLDK